MMDDKGMPIERFVFEVDLGEEDVITYDPMDLQKEFCSFLLKVSMAEAYQLPLPEGSTWALMVETKEPMPGGEHWLKTDLPSEGAAILPLKSGLLTKHKMQLFIETFAPWVVVERWRGPVIARVSAPITPLANHNRLICGPPTLHNLQTSHRNGTATRAAGLHLHRGHLWLPCTAHRTTTPLASSRRVPAMPCGGSR